jgi:hypothetical protein
MAVDVPTLVGSSSSRTAVTGAIRQAAQVTGTSFDYLLATAKVESDLNPNLTMRSSSATGLFQFLDQTWLATLKQGGPAFGYGAYANAIARTPSGRYVVADPSLRGEIMRLRKDPTANALMGGVVTQLNAAQLAKRIGRAPSEGELYIAHFFGPYAAAKAIKLAGSDPTANAAAIFPAAAAANRPIFHDKQGNARSIAGVCAELMRRYQVARAAVVDVRDRGAGQSDVLILAAADRNGVRERYRGRHQRLCGCGAAGAHAGDGFGLSFAVPRRGSPQRRRARGQRAVGQSSGCGRGAAVVRTADLTQAWRRLDA